MRPPNDPLVMPLGNGAAVIRSFGLAYCFEGLPARLDRARGRREREQILELQRILQPEYALVMWPSRFVSPVGQQRDAIPPTDRQALPQEMLTTAEVAAKTGLNVRTIRRWADELEIGKQIAGRRWYDPLDVAALVAKKEAA